MIENRDIQYIFGISGGALASLFIKDSEAAELATELAQLRGVTKTVAVRETLRREVEAVRRAKRPSLLERLDQYRREHPLPPPTGRKSDKAFFYELWGEV